jgi:hypothetical protein
MLWYGYQIYCLFLSGQVRFLKPYIVFVPIYPYNIMVTTAAVPDLPFCLGVFKHRAPLARWGPFSCQKQIMDSRHNDRVDSRWERVTKQAVRAQVRGLIA